MKIIHDQEKEDRGNFVHLFATDFAKAEDTSTEADEAVGAILIQEDSAIEELAEADQIIKMFLEECDVDCGDITNPSFEHTLQDMISYYQGADLWMTQDEQCSLQWTYHGLQPHQGDVSEVEKESISCQERSSINLRGGAEEEEEKIRGGAGGSNSTAKKRELKELIGNFQQWLDEVKDDDELFENDDLTKTMQKMVDVLKGKDKRTIKEAEAAKLIDIASGILGRGHQSFYEKDREAKKEHEGKGGAKGKGKGKGKSKSFKALPRFDLTRSFPKREITTWQSVMRALEGGFEPKGEVAICEDEQQIIELPDDATRHSI